MAKFIPYESPSEFLARKFRFIEELRSLYFKNNPFDDELITVAIDPRIKRAPLFLGGLNPVLAIGKDFVDTFKPYKSGHYIQKDFIQPIRGIGNTVKGLFHIIATPFIFLVNTVRYSKIAIEEKSWALFVENMTLGSVKAAGGFLDGVSNVIRGVTQLISTPLTWLFRMPLRGVMTLIQGKPTVCDNLDKRIDLLEALIKKDGKTVEDAILIDKEMQSIRVKTVKARERGQEIGADPEKIAQKFNLCQKFTEKKLSFHAFLTGIVDNNSYFYRADDSEYSRTKALSFLGLFKGKEVEETEVSDENNSLIQLSNRLFGRSFL